MYWIFAALAPSGQGFPLLGMLAWQALIITELATITLSVSSLVIAPRPPSGSSVCSPPSPLACRSLRVGHAAIPGRWLDLDGHRLELALIRAFNERVRLTFRRCKVSSPPNAAVHLRAGSCSLA